MSLNPKLTAIQHQVLALISSGFSATEAARQAGVHRHTVANWLHTEPFQDELLFARAYKKMLYWDQAEALAAKSIAGLGSLMDDPAVPPVVRLRACIAMLEHARLFLPEKSSVVLPDYSEPLPAPESPKSMHKNVQSPVENAAQTPAAAPQPPEPMHNNVQPSAEPVCEMRSTGPKIGRNELCPCGSGVKFKRCCLGKADPPAWHASAA